MRELKFRAWHPKIKRMMFDVWPVSNDEVCVWVQGLHQVSIGDMKGVILEQYTGLKDKHGTEIYEGDVVSIHMGHYNRPSLMDNLLVVWGGPWEYAAFGLTAKRCTHEQCQIKGEPQQTWDSLNPQYAKACEVIGNRWENPKLLEKT